MGVVKMRIAVYFLLLLLMLVLLLMMLLLLMMILFLLVILLLMVLLLMRMMVAMPLVLLLLLLLLLLLEFHMLLLEPIMFKFRVITAIVLTGALLLLSRRRERAPSPMRTAGAVCLPSFRGPAAVLLFLVLQLLCPLLLVLQRLQAPLQLRPAVDNGRRLGPRQL